MWVSHPQDKQVRLVLISVANCTFLLHMPSTVIWVIIYSVSLSRVLSLHTAHTYNTPKNKNTLFTAWQLLSLYSLLPPGLSLLPNPEWKGLRGSQMVDVWMPINPCPPPHTHTHQPACPCNSPLENPFACIMAPAVLFPLSHPPSSRERHAERARDERAERLVYNRHKRKRK